MREPLTTVPQTSAHFGHEGTRKSAESCLHNWFRMQLFISRKSILHNWWRIRALGFHQETTEETRQQQDWFFFCRQIKGIAHELSKFHAIHRQHP